MKILILDRHDLGSMLANSWERVLSYYGHKVDYEMFLRNCDTPLSEYHAVIAHPIKEDLSILYNEANTRPDFKLIFFNINTLNEVDRSSQFKNKNVFFKDFPRGSYLDELIRS